jgi:phospholipase/lecithinase/hemolysin
LVPQENGDIDWDYIGPDCFHPTRKGHHGFAYMLWNVMVTNTTLLSSQL